MKHTQIYYPGGLSFTLVPSTPNTQPLHNLQTATTPTPPLWLDQMKDIESSMTRSYAFVRSHGLSSMPPNSRVDQSSLVVRRLSSVVLDPRSFFGRLLILNLHFSYLILRPKTARPRPPPPSSPAQDQESVNKRVPKKIPWYRFQLLTLFRDLA